MRETFQSHHLFSVLRVLHMLVHFGTVQQHKEDVSLQQRIRSLERIKKSIYKSIPAPYKVHLICILIQAAHVSENV